MLLLTPASGQKTMALLFSVIPTSPRMTYNDYDDGDGDDGVDDNDDDGDDDDGGGEE